MIYLSIFCALLVYMIDYGIGRPSDEKPGYGSFLFGYSFYLAKRRIVKAGLHKALYGQLLEQLSNAKNNLERARIKKSYKEFVFTQGREMFTWEKAIGMCPVCFHFWVTFFILLIGNIFFYKVNIITFGLMFVISHALIRIFKKFV